MSGKSALIGENSERRRRRLEIAGVVTISRKGQILLPKHLRDKARIKPSDKLIVMTLEMENEVHCILLLKTEELAETATRMKNSVLE